MTIDPPPPSVVWYGHAWTPNIHFILQINVALSKFVLKSICEAGDGPDGKFRAIADPVWFQDDPDLTCNIHFI